MSVAKIVAFVSLAGLLCAGCGDSTDPVETPTVLPDTVAQDTASQDLVPDPGAASDPGSVSDPGTPPDSAPPADLGGVPETVDDVGTDAGEEPADVAPPEAIYQTVDPQTLQAWLDEETDNELLLINVHIPYAGEIPGTDLHVPYLETANLVGALDNEKGRKAVLYCLSGPMSKAATNALVEIGFYNVYDLPAAMIGWKNAGLPLTPP